MKLVNLEVTEVVSHPLFHDVISMISHLLHYAQSRCEENV